MVTTSLSERRGAGPGRFKACWITADPFIVSSTMVKMVVRTVALSSICRTLLVCLCWLQTKVYYRSHSLSVTRTKRISIQEGANSLCNSSLACTYYITSTSMILQAEKGVAMLEQHRWTIGVATS